MFDRCRILIVEDEYLLADDLRAQLEDAGAVVLGPEPSVAQALGRIAAEPDVDAAILDVNLGGEDVFPVAQALVDRHVPFLFSTGYESSMVKGRYPDAIVCDKPLNMRTLFAALRLLIDAKVRCSPDPA